MTDTATLHFSLDVVVPRIIELGFEEMPKEACGVVIPELGLPVDQWVRPMINRAETPESAYAIDPATIRGLVRDPVVWADVLVWHTHPSGHVGPSRGDLQGRVLGLRYLVIALPRGEAVMY